MVTAQPIVRATNVSKSYGPAGAAVQAVRGVSLEVGPSSLVALAGPSGSGKTTLLNLIGCIDRPDAGEIRIEGRNVSTLTPRALNDLRRDRLGFVFQSFNLIPVLTAFENIEYPLLLNGLPAARRRERVSELLEQVGLGGKPRRRPNELSGGERQRVAIARALANQPALVLADEPTANLDSANGSSILDLMDDLRDRRGVSFLFASHDPRLLDRMDRVVNLSDGAVVKEALCA
jgi:putative ABC transport system ATP-binding protein